MMRGIRLGTWVASIVVVAGCGGGQEEARAPDRAATPEMAAGRAAAQSSAAPHGERAQQEGATGRAQAREAQARGAQPPGTVATQQPSQQFPSLLEMIPEGTPRLAVLRVAEALRQPLFDELVTQVREMPRVAAQTERIEQQCGENPLSVVQELLVFDGGSGGPGLGEQGPTSQGPTSQGPTSQGPSGIRSPEMLVQLGRSSEWALQCLTTMRPEFSAMDVGGRPARRMGSFVVVDAGNNRLLVARQEDAQSALQRLSAAEAAEAAPSEAAERAEDLGDPLVFGTGAFANRMGVESAETVVSAEGEALELNLSGDMRDAEAAASAVRRLQLGLSIADAFVGRQVQDGQVQEGTQQRLRAVLDNVRIQQADDKVRVAVRLPDEETQRFVGGLLARFLTAQGAQRQQPPAQQGAPPAGG